MVARFTSKRLKSTFLERFFKYIQFINTKRLDPMFLKTLILAFEGQIVQPPILILHFFEIIMQLTSLSLSWLLRLRWLLWIPDEVDGVGSDSGRDWFEFCSLSLLLLLSSVPSYNSGWNFFKSSSIGISASAFKSSISPSSWVSSSRAKKIKYNFQGKYSRKNIVKLHFWQI